MSETEQQRFREAWCTLGRFGVPCLGIIEILEHLADFEAALAHGRGGYDKHLSGIATSLARLAVAFCHEQEAKPEEGAATPSSPEQTHAPDQTNVGGCQQAAGSPFESDTPETDAAQIAAAPHSGYSYGGWEFARKLERERNAAVSALQAIEARFCDGEDTYEDWKFMGNTARNFFESNTTMEARDK